MYTLRLPARLALVAGLLGTAGCYRYIPTQLEVTPQGQEVRLLVTRRGAVELAEVTDVDGLVPMLKGRIMGEEGEDLMLAVPVARRQVGFHQARLDQTIRVPQGEILSVEWREFDPVATGLFVAGTAALAGGVIFFIMNSFGNSDTPGDPGPTESRIPLPLVSIPIGH